jgi:hypothetical protein
MTDMMRAVRDLESAIRTQLGGWLRQSVELQAGMVGELKLIGDKLDAVLQALEPPKPEPDVADDADPTTSA